MLAALLLLAGLAGCANTMQDRQREATRAACRTQVDRAFEVQNRATFYRDNQDNLPFSSYGLPSNPTAGLSLLHRRETEVENCVRGSSANAPGG